MSRIIRNVPYQNVQLPRVKKIAVFVNNALNWFYGYVPTEDQMVHEERLQLLVDIKAYQDQVAAHNKVLAATPGYRAAKAVLEDKRRNDSAMMYNDYRAAMDGDIALAVRDAKLGKS
jgi:hypothetical protein